MKIAIIADIHDNLTNLQKFLNWAKDNKIEKIICCGDVTNGETLKFLANNFSKEIFLLRGNAEIYQEEEIKKYKNINYGGRAGVFEISGIKTGVCHEPFFIADILKKEKVDIIFYGHTHKPWIEDMDGVKTVNPGTLGGVFFRATFALWDTKDKEPELKILDLI